MSGEHLVSKQTEEMARKYGVVLVKLDPLMDSIGHNDYVAIAFRGGRIVRTGHSLWVRHELARMGIAIVGTWEPPMKGGDR